jgi:hypothetical protein
VRGSWKSSTGKSEGQGRVGEVDGREVEGKWRVGNGEFGVGVTGVRVSRAC